MILLASMTVVVCILQTRWARRSEQGLKAGSTMRDADGRALL